MQVAPALMRQPGIATSENGQHNMGYNLRIGEMKVDPLVTEPGEEVEVCIDAERHDGKGIGAPINSSDDTSNAVYPSYTAWSNFCDAVGLSDVFFNREGRFEYHGIIDNHPGVVVLCQRHLDRFKAALQQYTATKKRDGNETVEYNFRRLEWLVFWTQWALKNCKVPVFTNG
jgi:hypothetical protein